MKKSCITSGPGSFSTEHPTEDKISRQEIKYIFPENRVFIEK